MSVPARTRIAAAAWFPLAASLAMAQPQPFHLDYDAMAARIVRSLAPDKGERVVVRYDPDYFHELTEPLKRRLTAAGAGIAAEIPYLKPPENDDHRLAEALRTATIYLWTPFRDGVRYVSPGEQNALHEWLARGGSRREIHFHWGTGSVLPDGLAFIHPAAFDRLYQEALEIDYAALSARQDRVITALRGGSLRVRTPEGTDLTMTLGNRPFNKQDGDASPAHARAAKVRVDREIELPAGVVRVAPVESSVNGTLVIPEARFGAATARGIRLSIADGRITKIEARENQAEVEAALKAGGPAAYHFREIAVGANPKLAVPAASLSAPWGSKVLPYYGYGDAVVRLSLGDNEELGGDVRGGFVRWFFAPDATVTAGSRTIVKDGKLVIPTPVKQ
jgi:hypothetical protein